MNELEKYIRENRDQLDRVEEPNVDLIWQGIQRQMPEALTEQAPEKKIGEWHFSIGRNWRWAIAASVLLTIGLFYQLQTQSGYPGGGYATGGLFPGTGRTGAGLSEDDLPPGRNGMGLDQIEKEEFREIFQELEMLETDLPGTTSGCPSARKKRPIGAIST